MPQKLSLKRLTASDLTFFQWQFANRNAGNQKAINLNADVFIESLYPNLPDIAESQGWRVPVDLYLYGPGLAGEYNLQRKIVKGDTYKNWRLNGEFVYNPPDQPDRFNIMEPGDFAVIEFKGDLSPHTARVVLVSLNIQDDMALHAGLDELLSSNRMMEISARILEGVIEEANPASDHPIRDLILQDDLEDAALGGIRGIQRLQARASRRRIPPDVLQQARESAGRIGRIGEEFINIYLSSLQRDEIIYGFEWTSETNAVSPFDFSVNTPSGPILIEVKTTEGKFENPIHLSYNELLKAREAAERYSIYRVYEVIESTAKVRIVEGIRQFAAAILNILEQLPQGVRPDGVSVSPQILPFNDPITLNVTSEDS